MAEGGDFGYDDERLDYNLDHDDDDDNADETTLFLPKGTSTPYQSHVREEMEMKETHKKSGRPERSYAETSFSGTKDLEKRLADLRRENITGLLNTEGIPIVENPLSAEERGSEIRKVREFIRKRYPNADFKKLVISFSLKKRKSNEYCSFRSKRWRNQDNQR